VVHWRVPARRDRLHPVVREEQGSDKYRALLRTKSLGGSSADKYNRLRLPDLGTRPLSAEERSGAEPIPLNARVYRQDNLTSQSVGRDKGEGAASWFGVSIQGNEVKPSLRVRWKTNEEEMGRLLKASRVEIYGANPGLRAIPDDFSAFVESEYVGGRSLLSKTGANLATRAANGGLACQKLEFRG